MDRSKSSSKTKQTEQTIASVSRLPTGSGRSTKQAETATLLQESGGEEERSRNAPITDAEAVEAGETRRQRIAQRAYHLYEQDGRQDGRDVQHWLDAEHDLAGDGTSESETDGIRLT